MKTITRSFFLMDEVRPNFVNSAPATKPETDHYWLEEEDTDEHDERNIRSIVWTDIGRHKVNGFSMNELQICEPSTPQHLIALKALNDETLLVFYDNRYYNLFLHCGDATGVSQYWSRLAYIDGILIAGICCKIECDAFEFNREGKGNITQPTKSSNQKKTRIDQFFTPVRKNVVKCERPPKLAAQLHLQTLACRERFQRNGVSSRLIGELMRFCEESALPSSVLPRIETIYLYVQADNGAAVSFYEKFGFKTVERLSNYYRRLDSRDALRMELTI